MQNSVFSFEDTEVPEFSNGILSQYFKEEIECFFFSNDFSLFIDMSETDGS